MQQLSPSVKDIITKEATAKKIQAAGLELKLHGADSHKQYLVVSGDPNIPQNTIVLTIGTYKKVPLILRTLN